MKQPDRQKYEDYLGLGGGDSGGRGWVSSCWKKNKYWL